MGLEEGWLGQFFVCEAGLGSTRCLAGLELCYFGFMHISLSFIHWFGATNRSYVYPCGRRAGLEARPVSCPLAIAFDDIYKLSRNDTVSLFAWVKLIPPHEAIWAWIRYAIQVDVACYVQWCCAVEVVGWVVVDVGKLDHDC